MEWLEEQGVLLAKQAAFHPRHSLMKRNHHHTTTVCLGKGDKDELLLNLITKEGLGSFFQAFIREPSTALEQLYTSFQKSICIFIKSNAIHMSKSHTFQMS